MNKKFEQKNITDRIESRAEKAGRNLIGFFSAILLIVNTLFWIVPITLMALFKLAIPFEISRKFFSKIINTIGRLWISFNNLNVDMSRTVKWDLRGVKTFSMDEWYLVIANHQSWVDIIALQRIFNGRIPFLKFFLKKELMWVPLMGLAWWALDFPFMKRFSAEYIKKNPHMKGKDIEITRKACEKFRTIPVSVMNFIEGTRFTEHKHDSQKSPYFNLLKPKAGGIGFVLSTMGEQMHSILDITIVYPEGIPTFWDFLCRRTHEIIIDVEQLPVDDSLRGDYVNNVTDQKKFQMWLNRLWEDKDRKIDVINGIEPRQKMRTIIA